MIFPLSLSSAAAGACGRALALSVGGMAVEHARRRELAELVADHVLGDEHRNVLVAVVDAERQADELRQDRRAARSRS